MSENRDLGTLRRRFEAFAADGSLARLGSEARLVALYVLMRANWADCSLSMSNRHAAEQLGTHQTTVRRGISKLIQAGILQKTRESEGTRWAQYTVLEPKVVDLPLEEPQKQQQKPLVRRVRTPRSRPLPPL